MASPKTQWATADELRQRFNQDIQPNIDRGLYTLRIACEWPGPAFEPPGTRSKSFEVLNEDQEIIARCHAYVRPDGSYGASGRLDPKQIKVGDTVLCLPPERSRRFE
jgi:hypothetical protein